MEDLFRTGIPAIIGGLVAGLTVGVYVVDYLKKHPPCPPDPSPCPEELDLQLVWIVGPLESQEPDPQSPPTIMQRGDNGMFQIPIGKQVRLILAVLDKKGHPAAIDGPIVVTSSDETIGTATMQEDGSLIVASADRLGPAQINAAVDVDTTEGVKTKTGVFEIEVVAGEGDTISFAPGSLEDQP